jgi:hypothetical protein
MDLGRRGADLQEDRFGTYLPDDSESVVATRLPSTAPVESNQAIIHSPSTLSE